MLMKLLHILSPACMNTDNTFINDLCRVRRRRLQIGEQIGEKVSSGRN